MVVAVLTLWHFNVRRSETLQYDSPTSGQIMTSNMVSLLQGFPEFVDDEIVSVPDAKYTKGEFEVSFLLHLLFGHIQSTHIDYRWII